MTFRKRWTTDEHRAVQMLRGLQDEISQLQADEGDDEDVQMFRGVTETALASDTISLAIHDGDARYLYCDDEAAPGCDLGESE